VKRGEADTSRHADQYSACTDFDIMSNLMKKAEHYKLPMLVAHALPSCKQHSFMAFIDKLQYTLRMIPELREVLAHFPTLGKPQTKEANEALFKLLLAYCEYPLNTKLDQRRDDVGRSDGMDALRFLQNYCWTQDDPQKNLASGAFQSILINSDKSVAKYNNRFMQAYSKTKIAGLEYSKEQIVDR
jgi:hypothetical protein